MKLLLVAPIMAELANPDKFLDFDIKRGQTGENYRKSNSYASRFSYHEHELNQTWQSLPIPVPPPNTGLITAVDEFFQATCNGEFFYAAIVDCGSYFEDGGSVVNAEGVLTEAMRTMIRHVDPTHGQDMAWVERCALVSEEKHIPRTWFESDPLEWTARTSDESFEDLAVKFAWGNSAIAGELSPLDKKPILQAYIDTLAIWTDMERISQHAAKIVHDIASDNLNKSERKKLKESISGLEQLSSDVVYHHLLLNDVYLRIPGLRRVVVLKLLEAWSYEISATRLNELVLKAETLTNQRKASIDQKSRVYVEWVAFSLAVVGLMQITLGMYGAAFTGHSEEAPEELNEIRLLTFLRDFDFELVIGLTLLIVGGTIGTAFLIARIAGRRQRRRLRRTP